jgi:hypothetical protein
VTFFIGVFGLTKISEKSQKKLKITPTKCTADKNNICVEIKDCSDRRGSTTEQVVTAHFLHAKLGGKKSRIQIYDNYNLMVN